MVILKFGGTSVGTPDKIRTTLDTTLSITGRKILVLSAMAETTNKLKNIAEKIEKKQTDKAYYFYNQLKEEYLGVVDKLYRDESTINRGKKIIDSFFDFLKSMLDLPFTNERERIIAGQGELISTTLFHLLCQEKKIKSILLPALEFIWLDQNNNPDIKVIREKLSKFLSKGDKDTLYITQGYICTNSFGQMDNLGRGGSDYTATLIGAALKAKEVQIWTDINGLQNNDPRYVEKTFSIPEISYRVASNLAYYGAKILHPTCLLPVEKESIPIRIKNSNQPDANGTLIGENCHHTAKQMVSVKENEQLITFHSNFNHNSYDFLFEILREFSKLKINIDMISVTEQTVSLAIDAKHQLEKLNLNLKSYGSLINEEDYVIINRICKFQNEYNTRPELPTIDIGIPIQMSSFRTGEACNYSLFLVKSKYKIDFLNQLNQRTLEAIPIHKVKESA